MLAEIGTVTARQALRFEKLHLPPGLHDFHRLLGRGASEVGGSGATVELSDGRSLLDFGSYAVTLLGHRPPSVVAAVKAALDSLPTSTRLLPNATTATFSHRLVETIGMPQLDRIILGLNGSDVVEASLKLAMASSGVTRVLAVRGSFHGKTLGALATTFDPDRRMHLEPLLQHVTFLDPDADAVARALQDERAAALIFEPVQGEGGGRILDVDVIQRWCVDAQRAGAYVIADEIQVGLRRCGQLSLSAHLGLDVDAVLLGKPLGGGVMPLSAMICNSRLYRPAVEDPFFHTSTFGGHPLSCAAGLAALPLIEQGDVDAARIESLLGNGLAPLHTSGAVTETRCVGAFGVIDLVSADAAGLFLIEAARRGVLVAPCLTAPRTVRVLPPLVASSEEIEQGLDALAQAANSVARRLA